MSVLFIVIVIVIVIAQIKKKGNCCRFKGVFFEFTIKINLAGMASTLLTYTIQIHLDHRLFSELT